MALTSSTRNSWAWRRKLALGIIYHSKSVFAMTLDVFLQDDATQFKDMLRDRMSRRPRLNECETREAGAIGSLDSPLLN
ncbi:hypothetical protein CCR75_002874 [Bremia lactucae]|uniref:Uncharacterized protein n=1 Tax=Bremia lactucae TaxID=4779 RepID=A0A976FMT7_BRELC|nr:hypothetical protein CCR75_002874 [Bremia lactucae]